MKKKYCDYRKMVGPAVSVPEFENEKEREIFLDKLSGRILGQKKAIARKEIDERYRHCLILGLIGLFRLQNAVKSYYRDMGPV
ncbi:MAG: hypothetical protein ACOYB8_03690 [Eubacteriaceae bacterium]|jgi:hypothetical protein